MFTSNQAIQLYYFIVGLRYMLNKSDVKASNSCINKCGLNLLAKWKYEKLKINHVDQNLFNPTNWITSHQFVQELVTPFLL